jgi:hypothetical protein
VSLPQPVRAHRARPLPWLLAALALVAVVIGFGYRGLHDHRVWARSALHVDGEVTVAPRGGQLRASYRHPVTGQTVEVRVDTWGAADDLEVGDPVALEVDPDDPELLSVAGEHKPPVDGASLVLILCVPVAGCGLRWWSMRRTVGLAHSDGPAFALLGAVAPGGRIRRRPLLHLYPVDAAAGDASLCAVRVLNTAGVPLGGPAFPVQVKGVPRPMGRVVARVAGAPGAGEVLWPAARAVTSGNLPRPRRVVDVTPPPPVPPAELPDWVASGDRYVQRTSLSLALGPVLGLLAFFALFALVATGQTVVAARNDDADRAGRDTVVGEVVAKRHAFDHGIVRARFASGGLTRTEEIRVADAGDYTVGRRYPVLVDPSDPGDPLLAKERFDRGYQIVFVWLPLIPIAVLAGRSVRTWQRSRTAARRGPWYRLDLWPESADSLLLGDRDAGYVRGAIVGRGVAALRSLWGIGAPARTPGTTTWALTPPAAPLVVAGRPEADGVVALIDGAGDVYVVPARLRAPLGPSLLGLVEAAGGRSGRSAG